MEPQFPRSLVLRTETIAHDLGPQLARGAEFRDLLEEVAMRVEEERNAGGEVVHVEPRVDPVLHVLDSVAKGERELLRGSGAGLANVIAAHRDRIPLRDLLRTELEDVGDEPHRFARRIDVLLL